jgi:hypothetical protein
VVVNPFFALLRAAHQVLDSSRHIPRKEALYLLTDAARAAVEAADLTGRPQAEVTQAVDCLVSACRVRPSADAKQRFLDAYEAVRALGAAAAAAQAQADSDAICLAVQMGKQPIDGIILGPDRGSADLWKPWHFYATDAVSLPDKRLLICPRADPKPPPELLPDIADSFRRWNLIGPDEGLLWVGQQSTEGSLCCWGRGCTCHSPAEGGPGRAEENTLYLFALVGDIWNLRYGTE